MASGKIKGPQKAIIGPLTFLRDGHIVGVQSAWEPTVSANASAYTTLGTLPEGLRPTQDVYIDALYGNQKEKSGTMRIQPSGNVAIATNATSGTISNQILWLNGVYSL